jgi:hypothetical protein
VVVRQRERQHHPGLEVFAVRTFGSCSASSRSAA